MFKNNVFKGFYLPTYIYTYISFQLMCTTIVQLIIHNKQNRRIKIEIYTTTFIYII